MPKFDAGTAVEQLEYDFLAHPQYDGTLPGKGRIPEFTDKQLREFAKALTALEGPTNEIDPETPKGQRKLSEMMADGSFADKIEATAKIIAAFCKDSPSEAEIMGLPVPTRRAFFNWLMEELFNPKAKTPDSGRPRR